MPVKFDCAAKAAMLTNQFRLIVICHVVLLKKALNLFVIPAKAGMAKRIIQSSSNIPNPKFAAYMKRRHSGEGRTNSTGSNLNSRRLAPKGRSPGTDFVIQVLDFELDSGSRSRCSLGRNDVYEHFELLTHNT
jgi:hypothetical protein